MKTMVTGTVAMTAVLALAGPAAAAQGNGASWLARGGRFEPVAAGAALPEAVTYDEELVPEGAVILVTQSVKGGRMTIRVTAAGLVPGHTYGSHVHTGACGAVPEDSGPHYQHIPGRPTSENEVWLDFTATEAGIGYAVARQDWVFREGGANSVVLHEHATSHGHDGGAPGTAGGRAGCFTVAFEGEG